MPSDDASETTRAGETTGATEIDGRRRRRELGRLAVIDAVIDLILDHHVPPAAEQVAERAGVSVASVFRYFATLDDLRREGIQRYFERIDHLVTVPGIGDGALAERIHRLVAARLDYYEQAAPVARLARRQAADVPELRSTLQRVRSTLADQISQHFALELDDADPERHHQRVGVLATLTSFESWDQLIAAGFAPPSIAEAWRRAIMALLAAG